MNNMTMPKGFQDMLSFPLVNALFVNSQERKNLAKDAERLYSGEYWVKHFEIRSSTI